MVLDLIEKVYRKKENGIFLDRFISRQKGW